MNRLRKNIRKQFHLQQLFPPPKKVLRKKLTNYVNDLYKENNKPLKKEIEKDYRRWKDLPCL
jgi:hypothetical protein